MYRTNDVDPWREHRRELLAEAEGEHLARRLKDGRPKRPEFGAGLDPVGRCEIKEAF